MKFFIAIALIATVASATYTRPTPVSGELAEIQEIVAAINNPSTDPTTAVALEQMLLDLLGVEPEPISVGPAIIEANPVSVGPAIIDFPLPDGGVVTAPVDAVAPSPAVVGPTQPAQASPLVQIILNINQADSFVPPASVIAPESPFVPEPVIVVEEAAVVEPVQVVDTPTIVEPVQVVDTPTIVPEPVIIGTPVLPAVVVPEPVIIGTPIIPAPAVVLPETLN